MVTLLLWVAGSVLLVAFCVAWPPGALLVLGVALLLLALVRMANERATRGNR